MKRLLFACAILGSLSFAACTDVKISKVIKIDNGVAITQTDTDIQSISSKDYTEKEIVSADTYNASSIILEDKIVNISSDKKSLEIIYNDGTVDNINVQNSGYKIRKHISNGDYIIWVETNSSSDDLEDIKKEIIHSRNLKTGEINKVDEIDYSDTKFKAAEKGVEDINISDTDKIVYMTHKVNEYEKVEEEIISYDLLEKRKNVIAKVDEKNREFLSPSINGDDVIYLENILVNDEVIEQNLYFNNIKTANSDSLKTGLEIISLDFYGDHAGMISKRDDGEKVHTEFQIFDMTTFHTTSRIFEGSKAANYIAKTEKEKFFEGSEIEVDDSYIYILGNLNIIYDIKANKFMTLGDKDIYSSKIGEKQILVTNYKTAKAELYTLAN